MSGFKASEEPTIEILPYNPYPLEDTPADITGSFKKRWRAWREGKEYEGKKLSASDVFTPRWNYWREKGHSLWYILAHYFCFYVEFLLHHFFVLSGSMRIYLIVYFILFGGTFYAVAPTFALGCVFFFSSVLISLALSNLSRWINHKVDTDDRQKQLQIKKLADTYHELKVEGQNEEKAVELIETGSEQTPTFEKWKKIEDMKDETFNWLNYKNVLNDSNYLYVIYVMDILIVVAAMWNIIEEILRWQAVLPFGAALTAMGPFWVIFTLAVLAIACLIFKLAYTYPVTKVRLTNMQLLQKARNHFEHTVKYNEALRAAFAEVEDKESLKDRELGDVLPVNTSTQLLAAGGALIAAGLLAYAIYAAIPLSVPLWSVVLVPSISFLIMAYCSYRLLAWLIHERKKENTPGGEIRRDDAKNKRVLEDLPTIYKKFKPLAHFKDRKEFCKKILPWTLLASALVSGLLTFAVYSLVPSLPLWSLIVIPLVSLLAFTGIFSFALDRYNDRTKKQEQERIDVARNRAEREQAVAQQLKEKYGEQYSDEHYAALASLAYSLWKLKNAHRFKRQRDLLDGFLDNIGIPAWNAAITIFPTFFIINGICVTFFLLPSVLNSWPLFIIELIPAVILAIDFGRRKFGDNKHDLIKDAACDIFEELTNPKNGKFELCLQQKKNSPALFTLGNFGLELKADEKKKFTGGERRQSVTEESYVGADALVSQTDKLGLTRERDPSNPITLIEDNVPPILRCN